MSEIIEDLLVAMVVLLQNILDGELLIILLFHFEWVLIIRLSLETVNQHWLLNVQLELAIGDYFGSSKRCVDLKIYHADHSHFQFVFK